VVEDEVKLANPIKRALELQKYAVDVAYDGEAAADMAIGESYDLMVLDLMLPKIDGMEVCRRVRHEGVKTPILMLTAKGQISDKVEGLDVGADDYMVKPFSFEELFARVRALVRRSVGNEEAVLKVKNLTLDPVTFKVMVDNKNVEVSSKEFAILEYLLRHKNQVITREKIVNHVWNYDADILPNTVEVHVKHLRGKIGNDIIKTVRGFGYEIREEE